MFTTTPPSTSILLVEDEAVLSLDLCVRLEAEGYTVIGVATTGRQALALFEQQPADIVICDINLRGDWTGIETARRIIAHRRVPIIYLSALTDRTTIEQAKDTKPAAYLTKPVTTDNLRIAIEIALNNFTEPTPSKSSIPVPQPPMPSPKDGEMILQVGDSIFIKQNYQFVRLHQADVLYAEADDKYTTVVTATRKFVLRLPLAALLQRLMHMTLVRVHRSFAVNMGRIESFNDYEIQVSGQALPLGRVYKDEFLRHFSFR